MLLSLLLLLLASASAALSGYTFLRHDRIAATSAVTPVLIRSDSRGSLECSTFCEDHDTCVAFQVGDGGKCLLYATDVLPTVPAADPNSLFLQEPVATVMPAPFLNLLETVGANSILFMEHAVPVAGDAYMWKVHCSSTGKVWLGVWRHQSSNIYTLIGASFVSVTDTTTTTTHVIPKHDRFLVQAGDLISYFFPSSGSYAYPYCENGTPQDQRLIDAGITPGLIRYKTGKGFVVGDTKAWESSTTKRLPGMHLYIA